MKTGLLLEVSWEVCNKVGGIYTVIASKAEKIISNYEGEYYLIGPYFGEKKVLGQFEEKIPPKEMKEISQELKNKGVEVHFGTWLIKGHPNVILVDFSKAFAKINEIKRWLWDNYKIDSLNAPSDYDEPIVWSYAVFLLINEIAKSKKKIVAQFHEWLAGSVILHLKKNNVKVATVFTTHATVLGRTLASHNVDLYCKNNGGKCALELMNLDKEAYNYGVASKHQVERSAAQNSDVFTTVSEITGMEATYILQRKPDVLLPNGLDIEKFPTFEEISIEHRQKRDRIREFLLYYFFPYHTFVLRDTLFYFIAGRYEFHDKGVDVFIKALGRLNEMMKKEKSKKTVVVFIWIPANIKGIKPELLENRTYFNDLKEEIEDDIRDIQKRILFNIISQWKLNEKTLFDEDFLMETKRKVLRLKKGGNPPLSTHDLFDENDIILRSLKEAGLENKKIDNVKLVFYPIYLNGADGLLDLTYYEAMQGSHLGVFPSFYEPWGYTPLEAGALGVSSVTTDLAGFGRYIIKESGGNQNPGIFVLKRLGRTEEEIVNDLANIMFYFAGLTKHGRIENKMAARELAAKADWGILINNYTKAHNLALKKIWK